jgi:hypothetical protein
MAGSLPARESRLEVGKSSATVLLVRRMYLETAVEESEATGKKASDSLPEAAL